MSDETTTTTPDEGTTATATTEATFSAADVERILAADREQRAASTEPDDPVAKFRATTAGTKLYATKPTTAKPTTPQPQPQGSRIETLVESMLALQIAGMKPPAPPAPPKLMSVDEKLTSADPTIWLRRGNPNEFTTADRAQITERHRQQLIKEGFRGWVDIEADRRASREIAAAGQRALANVKVDFRDAGMWDAFNAVVRK